MTELNITTGKRIYDNLTNMKKTEKERNNLKEVKYVPVSELLHYLRSHAGMIYYKNILNKLK